MKKIFFFFIILSSILMFYSFIDIYKEQDIQDVIENFEIMADKPLQSITFTSNIYKHNQQFIYDLKQLADEDHITIVKQSIDIKNNCYINHIYTHEDLSTITNLAIKDKIDFSSLNTKNFYSNYQKNQSELFILNHDILVDIKPFSYLINNRYCIGTYDFYASTKKDLSHFIDSLNQKYSSYIEQFNDFEKEPHASYFLNPEMKILILFSFILFATFLAIWISKNSYKNTVYYLHGYSTLEMYFELYGITFVQGIGISILSLVILFLIRIQQINVRTIPFIIDCLKYLGIQWLGIFSIFFIYIFIQKCQHSAILLKKKNINKILLQGHFFIKLLSLIILLPPLTSHCLAIENNINTHRYMKEQFNGIENYQHIYSMKFEYQDSQYLESYDGKTNNVTKIYQDAYDLLEKNKAIYYTKEPLYYTSGTLIRTNANYLSLCPLIDPLGHQITMQIDNQKKYLFVPEDIYNTIHEEDFLINPNDSIEKIAIASNQKYIKYLDGQYNQETIHQPTCIFIDSKQSNRKPYGGLYIPLSENKINDLLKNTPFENTLLMKSLEDTLRQETMLLPSLIKNDLEIAMCFFIFLDGLVFEYFYLYYNIYRKDFAIKKMHGYSFIELTYPIFVESLSVYALSFLYFIIQQYQPLTFLFILLFIDMIIHLLIYGYLYHRKISTLLWEE